jgi:uncharacterized membrane protein
MRKMINRLPDAAGAASFLIIMVWVLTGYLRVPHSLMQNVLAAVSLVYVIGVVACTILANLPEKEEKRWS